MLQRKVCMLGTLGVGKTSLVRRFVDSMFQDEYKTTVGVKIDKKVVRLERLEVTLMLWDIEGVDQFKDLHHSHLRGAAGYLLIVDGTRPKSLAHALEIEREASTVLGNVPRTIAFNKSDLQEQWTVPENELDGLRSDGRIVMTTSAKTGDNVEAMFRDLADRMTGHE